MLLRKKLALIARTKFFGPFMPRNATKQPQIEGRDFFLQEIQGILCHFLPPRGSISSKKSCIKIFSQPHTPQFRGNIF